MTTKHHPSSRADSYAPPPEDPPRSRSDELLRLAISGAALGTWQRDLRSGALTWSKRMFELFGIEPRPDISMNLALNARDAMPSGGELTLRVSRDTLDPDSAQQLPEARPGSWACLTVSDTGEGIAPETLPHIFEPFFTTKPVGQGTGLGLSTVYGIVKQHRGFVSVESRPARGTTFKVFLPLPEVATAVTLASAPSQPLGGRKELVLLVEDDAAVRGAMSSLLVQHDYRLLVADDAMQALELFATRGDEIALLLSDVVLPRGLSGADLALQLRQLNPRLQVILCSGYSADKIEQSRHALPGMVFLQKPYRVELLLASMRSLLDQAQTAAHTSAHG